MVRAEAIRQIRQRLARIEARVRRIREMIDEGQPCDDVLTEIRCAESALEQTARAVAEANAEEWAGQFSSAAARAELERTFMLLAGLKG